MNTIHILGIGNIGKLFAYALKKSDPSSKVVLLLHRKSLASDWEVGGRCIELVTNGVSVKQGGLDVEVLSPQTPPESGAFIKNLIVATKTYDTTKALSRVQYRLDGTSSILFLQNGMGVVEEVSRKVFNDGATKPHFLAGITSHGVYNTGPFSIVHAGLGKTIFGPVLQEDQQELSPDDANAASQYLRESLAAADILSATSVTASAIREAQLEKLVINAIINPLTVLLDCRNGLIFDQPDSVSLARQLLGEAGPIVRTLLYGSASRPQGDRFSDESLWRVVQEVAQKTGQNVSSMLQDVRAGRPTEIDYINGYLVQKGDELGLPNQNNAKIVQLVKSK
ncbi:2-dehydropantoate 2-reductase [Hypoxylon sp. FL0543]|nr:2-dehydropantoate 2-reductase [Hypoxylon sp. FL0543]